MYKILIVEDDAMSAKLVTKLLTKNGYQPRWAADANEALKLIKEELPDLLLLDLGLPGVSGMSLCDMLRKEARTAPLPIVMLTSRKDKDTVVEGLKTGADDYLTKPFSEKELLARVESVLRRSVAGPPASSLESGPLRVDMTGRVAFVDGRAVELGPKEFDLLALFLKKKGVVLSAAAIAQAVWGDADAATPENIRYWLHRLRSKLGAAGERIHTVSHLGYKLEP